MTRYRLQSAGRAAEEQNWIAVIGSVAAMGDEAQKLGLVRWEVESRAIENLFKDGHIEEGKAALAGLQPFCLEAIDALREFLD